MQGLSPIRDWLDEPPEGWLQDFRSVPMDQWSYLGEFVESNNGGWNDHLYLPTIPEAIDDLEIYQPPVQHGHTVTTANGNDEQLLSAPQPEDEDELQLLPPDGPTQEADCGLLEWRSSWGSEAAPQAVPPDLSSHVARLTGEVLDLQESLRTTQAAVEGHSRGEKATSEKLDAVMRTMADISKFLNHLQLHAHGLGPLVRRFGIVLGPRRKKSRRSRRSDA